MITIKDIKNLGEYLKDIFVTKEEFQKLDGKIDNLTSMIDSFAKESQRHSQELTVLSHRMDRAENNIDTLAEKIDVTLNY
jgi:uncharacterized coiled-coil DUF342 family protein